MHDFEYRQGTLHCGEVSLEEIAEKVGTPFYCYSLPTLRRHINAFEEPLSGVDHQTCFAMKANANLAILSYMAHRGLGADVVSGGDLYRALKAGIPGGKIVYSGVGKTTAEIDMAIDAGIMMFNIESAQELEVINERAGMLGRKAPVSIRVNPDVDPMTHPYISTGLKENKFGIDVEGSLAQYLKAKDMENIEIVGIDCHIGSQLTDLSPFIDAVGRLKMLIERLKEHGITLKYLDLGGGLGITYSDEEPPHPRDYVRAVLDAVGPLGLKLIFEPGRVIVGNAGVLVARVLYRKQTRSKTFIVVDAGMNDLIRPALYGAYHDIRPVREKTGEREQADVVGPICESGDFLAKNRNLPVLVRDDLIAVMSAGAYGFTMASNYNSRPRPPEVLVDGARYHVVLNRQTYEDLVSGETVPREILV
ncbi:MAG: diaminopimelate decarboxylase [Desulfomonilia bacterium]|jgi:diaminopimelate decarboxylase|uniref:diaminopimelate decarboxylase n=1 Tax=anaerobic digester metagenome TaxID=1263854 RepID=A0A485LZZ3_9ZZZZ|nr:diaminopimelate decarboxylase [Pseudomonadota bacterium]HON37583.1 diaminopimelate decarboxylase [Deltaproteobacteria bacterium]HRS55090.1 diaminopimelate decarboxylase [Desulfomonilia bacterium]HPD21441.1 diaminopimelate decarboxylase [Deltaproteobacteria bacterium]HPX19487.1 diaminopimelate decarboxylase [Deltaproteobacteria bacterium]